MEKDGSGSTIPPYSALIYEVTPRFFLLLKHKFIQEIAEMKKIFILLLTSLSICSVWSQTYTVETVPNPEKLNRLPLSLILMVF
jgi:hypothetical protein